MMTVPRKFQVLIGILKTEEDLIWKNQGGSFQVLIGILKTMECIDIFHLCFLVSSPYRYSKN